MKGKRRVTTVLLMFTMLFLPAANTLAGGWVVITLDALPDQIRAGETVRLGFMVRQHGVRPVNDIRPSLSAANRDTGETVTATAEQVGADGHFEVAVRFPHAGVWEWQLAAPPFPQEVQFEPLMVLPAGPTEAGTPLVGAGNGRLALRWSGVAFLGLALLLRMVMVVHRRREEVAVPGTTG